MTTPQIERRTLARGAVRADPVILASTAVPAFAASVPQVEDNCTYGKIVSAPWSNVWPSQGNFTGSVTKELEWAVYPTSSCVTGLPTFSLDNSLPAAQAGNHLTTPSATAPTYPAGGSPDADIISVNGINSVGQGTIISVTIENVSDDVVYHPTPTGTDRFIFR